MLLGIAVLAVVPACGQTGPDSLVNLTLSLEPRLLPEETTEIRYYVLPNVVMVEGEEVSLDCTLFLGSDGQYVFDYDEFFVRREREPVDPATRIDIPIFKLPVGRHLFYLEAYGEGSNDPLACGCNDGMIEAGEKIQVRIRMIFDCV